MLSRRLFVQSLAAGVPLPALAAPARPRQTAPVVTVLGDSLTSGWGLTPQTALPAQLASELSRLGAPAVVRGAGVPGDTSAGGLARVDSVRADTDLCVVMLGANDFLLSVDPKETEANLGAIVRRLKRRGLKVVLAGGQAPNGRVPYGAAFNRVFPSVAQRTGTPLASDLLSGVVGRPALNQPDGLHPNARGIRIIASRLAPVVARELKRA